MVVARCGGLCEQCKKAPIEHVHHTTYQHLGEEGLEDVVGLCFHCHQKQHPDRKLRR